MKFPWENFCLEEIVRGIFCLGEGYFWRDEFYMGEFSSGNFFTVGRFEKQSVNEEGIVRGEFYVVGISHGGIVAGSDFQGIFCTEGGGEFLGMILKTIRN